MLENARKMLKEKCRLPDWLLRGATAFARGAELWCASGVVFWGGAVALGLGALGLQALGVPIPAAVGVSSLVFGTVMAVKSVALRHGFRLLHKKGLAVQEQRGMKAPASSPAPKALPVTVARISKIAPACQAFNMKAKERLIRALAALPHPAQKRSKLKTAGLRLRL